MRYPRSLEYQGRAARVLGLTSPFSKDVRYFGGDDRTAYPAFLAHGAGARVQDVDGRTYLDWVSGLGAVILGYMTPWPPTPMATGLSLPSYLEVEVAEKIAAFAPIEQAMVRFAKTGSEACAAAVRLARAATGREIILSIGFHGCAPEFVAATPPAWGIPSAWRSHVISAPHDLYQLQDWLTRQPQSIAAVIIEEPITPSPPSFYANLLAMCHTAGALLVMDEVVTGFRWPQGSVMHAHGIQPDLVVYGKALANGHALAALVGPQDLMHWFCRRDPVFVSTTNAGETNALAAASATLDTLANGAIRQHIDQIGAALIAGLNTLAPDILHVIGVGCRSLVTFPFGDGYLCQTDEEAWAARSLFIQQMGQRGILINRPNFPTAAHTLTDVQSTLEAAKASLEVVRREVEQGTLAKTMQRRVAWRLFRDR